MHAGVKYINQLIDLNFNNTIMVLLMVIGGFNNENLINFNIC